MVVKKQCIKSVVGALHPGVGIGTLSRLVMLISIWFLGSLGATVRIRVYSVAHGPLSATSINLGGACTRQIVGLIWGGGRPKKGKPGEAASTHTSFPSAQALVRSRQFAVCIIALESPFKMETVAPNFLTDECLKY